MRIGPYVCMVASLLCECVRVCVRVGECCVCVCVLKKEYVAYVEEKCTV